MKLTNFFKKIIKKKEVNDSIMDKNKFTFDKVEPWVSNKEKEINNREKEIFTLIKNRVQLLTRELDIKIKDLESIDIDSKEANDKVKVLVKASLEKYIGHLKSLMDSINHLNEDNFEKFIYWINNVFIDFETKSYISYQRAAFLTGNDIIEVRKNIADFSKYLINILDKNKDIIDSSRAIHSIQLKLNQVSEANKVINGFEEKVT